MQARGNCPRFFLFCLALISNALPAYAADVSLCSVYKRLLFVQTNSAAPVPACCPCIFNSIVEPATSNSVTVAALTGADGRQTQLESEYENEFLPRRWILFTSTAFPSRASLDAACPGGEHRFSILGANDGLISPVINLSGDSYPTNPPHIQNFDEAQRIDSTKDFTLKWDPWTEGTTNDACFVLMRKLPDKTPVSNTPFLQEVSRLDGTATSIVIPAGTLNPAQQYEIYVRFDKIVHRDVTTHAGLLTQASYASGTECSLKTAD